MEKLTFVIPSKDNLRYLKWCVAAIRDNAHRKDHDILVLNDNSKDGTREWCDSYAKTDENFRVRHNDGEPIGIGPAYNVGAREARTDLVLFWHADMILARDSDLKLMEAYEPGGATCMTRIEPPLHPSGPEKVTLDLGMWPEPKGIVQDGFDVQAFHAEVEKLRGIHGDRTTKGLFAPWVINRHDLLALGGHDERFTFYFEDSDIFNRMVLAGMKLTQSWSAYAYHLTCRAGKFQYGIPTPERPLPPDKAELMGEWQKRVEGQNMDFIRKWGTPPRHDEHMYPVIYPIYDIAYDVTGVNLFLIKLLEPFCSTLIIDSQELKDEYVAAMQPYCRFDLASRILVRTGSDVVACGALVRFDASKLNEPDLKFLLELPLIIEQTGTAGAFEYGMFRIDIADVTPRQQRNIYA